MSFFRKLRDRMMGSSSKIDQGLEALVEDGAEAPEDVRTPPAEAGPSRADTDGRPQSGLRPDAAGPAPEEGTAPEGPSAPEPAAPTAPDPAAPPPAAPAPAPRPPAAPEPRRPDPGSEAARDAAPKPAPRTAPDTAPEAAPVGRSTAPAPEPAPSDPVPAPPSAPAADPAPRMEAEAEAPKRGGFLGRLFRREEAAVPRRVLDDEMLEDLEDLLISADMGTTTAARVAANLAEGRMGRRMSVREIKEALAAEIARIMEPVARPLPIYPTRPQVVLVVGVNGSGKTTTIGKLASQFRAAGKSVVIAAGDTFRAAAVEQLQVWGERAGVPVLTAPEGSDPASLAFDAMGRAQADGADLLMIDTAGRLQNRADLMEELAKIVRVIRKKDPDAPHNTLLVLDATTGQNAVGQVEIFQRISDVSGLVMTKLDGTAKGGVLVALADRFGLPIHAIGVGEQIDDLSPFDPEEFAAALVGLDGE
ncbi:signal recognition particle-docking protein FtsY [Wenxinia saemankumensis]|uniref:Signal recognition particle receptor FtsY n=1 Tax=Wenxinia saemankumensis TaxID=1447782 RepID=A0A1M6CKV1_9RHOB|nr:signal recognition particle-docking protein FtsY [Wenxinia saemankumensis]SHI61637.1 signal recognition particle-docking protein FtsY [Wenxinia saemankumensis]